MFARHADRPRWFLSGAQVTALLVAVMLGVAAFALSRSGPSDVTLRIGGGPYQPIFVPAGERLCQAFTVVPAGTSHARYRVFESGPLPAVTLKGPGVPQQRLAPLRRTNRSTATTPIPDRIPRNRVGRWELCITPTSKAGASLIGLNGRPALVLAGPPLGSWLAALPTLAERAAVGRAGLLGEGALPIGILLAIVGLALSTIAIGHARGTAAISRRAITLVALASVSWNCAYAVTTPPLQTPDEGAHQQIVELLHDQWVLPRTIGSGPFAPELDAYMKWSGFGGAFQQRDGRPAWSHVEEARLDRQIAAREGLDVSDVWSSASSQPPGYYGAVAAISTVAGGDVRDRMLIGRLLSALLMAAAVAGGLVFARSAVPSAGGLALVAATVVATNPLVAFMGGAVNPDAALAAATAWALAGLAVALRSGLTWKRGLWIGSAIGAGLLSKLTFLALALPLFGALVALAVREARRRGVRVGLSTIGLGGITAAAVGLPFYLWAVASGRGLTLAPPVPGPPPPGPGLLQWITYTLQLYVARVPPMDDQLAGWGPDIFVSGFVGTLGWLDYGPPFETWRYFRIVAGALLLLAFLGLVRSVRRRGWASAGELAIWATVSAGLLCSISLAGLGARLAGQPGFEQGRYLLPLIPIAVAGIALALRQVPGRLQRPVAVMLGIAGLAHGVVLYLMTIGRYFA